MSAFPKSARHPELKKQSELWGSISETISTDNDNKLSLLEPIQTATTSLKVQKTTKFIVIDNAPILRPIVGANAVRLLGKSYESFDAFLKCDHSGISASASVLAYQAAFFAARCFCLFMGFCPIDRESNHTIDVFYESLTTKKSSLEDFACLFVYKRWGHKELWELVGRLINTLKVDEGNKYFKEDLRKQDLLSLSKERNRFQYDDSVIFPFDSSDYCDFPDQVSARISSDQSPENIRRHLVIAIYFTKICMTIVNDANLNGALRNCTSDSRLKSVDEISDLPFV